MGRAGVYPGTHWLFLCVFMVFLIRWTDPGGVGSEVNAHGLYASHNFCISHKVRYDMELFADDFSVFEKIWLHPLENVYECYIHAEKFEVIEVRASASKNESLMVVFDPVLQLLPYGIYSLRRSYDKMWSYEEKYMIQFSATKSFSKVGEGLTFKMYRDRSTFKRSWYAFVHMSPSQCGKAFFCTNNLKDLHSLRIQAIHWKTHNLNCAGTTTTKSHSNDKAISVCLNTFKVGVNNMHYSLTNFPKLDYVTNGTEGEQLHHITIVAPKNEQSVMYPMIVEQFDFILRIYSLLLLTTNLKQFHVIFYVFPNYHKDVPEVFSGSCYYKLENLLSNIDLETTQRSYLKCLLHQGYMNERITDSWVLRYVPEGLFEQLVNKYEVQGVKNDYYKSVLLGDENELDSLARYDKYLGDIPLKRPWRKAAGFWQMLASISPSYGEKTYREFEDNIKPIESQADFVQWITKHCELLELTPKEFLEMHYTWTATKGYPILVAKVTANRTVCVSQYSEGMFFSSRIIPYTLDYNFAGHKVKTDLLWITAKGQDNCHSSNENLFPYLVNGNLNMVGRVLYDPVNWQVWAESLMKRVVRNSLTTMQMVSLIMDALYFAQNNQLDWAMSFKFLVLVRDETDELAWRSYDKVLSYLESLTRYTQIYTMYKKLVAEIVQKYYYSRDSHPTGLAIKWSCFAGVVECLRYTEEMTARTLVDHEYMPNRTEVLCGGMRRMTMEKFRYLIGSMGKPDWREPIFYIEIITCSNNGKILRELMHHLFFYQSWYFRTSLLQKLLIEMIEHGKAGSDAVLYYLDHNPKGMLKQLEIGNLLDVFEVLSKYTRHCLWLQRFIKRMEVYRSWDEKHLKRLDTMFVQMRKNKMWYNRHYSMFAKYLVEGYLVQLSEYEP